MRLPSLLLGYLLCTCVCDLTVATLAGPTAISGVHAQRYIPYGEVLPTLRELHAKLVEHHPFAYFGDGREILDTTLYQLEAELAGLADRDSLTYVEFLGLAAEFQRVTRDGHLQFAPKFSRAANDSLRAYSVRLRLRELTDGTVVNLDTLVAGTDTLTAYAKILTVAGRPVGELLGELAQLAGANDSGNESGARYHTALGFSRVYQRWYGRQDSLSVTGTPPGSTRPHQLHLQPQRRKLPPHKPPRDSRRNYHLRAVADSSAFVLRVVSFNNDRFGKPSFRKLSREYFATLKEAGARALVIDLRNNTGGSLDNAVDLFAYLSEARFPAVTSIATLGPTVQRKQIWHRIGRWFDGIRKRDGVYVQPGYMRARKPVPAARRYTGRVVVLVNPLTFSASGLTGRYVQGSGRGLVVGETSGASVEVVYGGSTRSFTVGERHKFELKLKNWQIVPTYPGAGNLVPDLLVPVTQGDLLQDRDPQLEAALELLTSD